MWEGYDQKSPADLHNEDFNDYYQQQGCVPPEEWNAFLEALRRPLPLTFRINGSGHHAEALRNKLKDDFLGSFADSSSPITIDGEAVEPPKSLPWYPNELAWQVSGISRRQLCKVEHLESLHNFMKVQNDSGGITRQEAVSMIPPLFLDVQPHHKVLDMCAAPGSKTVQILEALHAGRDVVPPGFVIANDVDFRRCNMLTHQTKRLCSPCMVISNHEAQGIPVITHPETKEKMKFDRILCDVPCSGDGTMRKNPEIWRRWNANNGNGLHLLQLKITLHACRLLRVGGRIVFSTCTFNPIEDEAVVAEVLRRAHGSLQLVDVSHALPGLKRMPGMHQWIVKDKKNVYATYEESQSQPSLSDKSGAEKLIPSMFPQGDEAELHLERCMRFLPHHSDTGGFFVAVLEKTRESGEITNPPTWIQIRRKRSRDAKDEGIDAVDGEGKEEDEDNDENDGDDEEKKPEVRAAGPTAASVPAGTTSPSSPALISASPVAEPELKRVKSDADVVPEVPSGVVAGRGRHPDQPEGAPAPHGTSVVLPAAPTTNPQPATPGSRHKGIDPISPVTDEASMQEIILFYGIVEAEIPAFRNQLITRSTIQLNPKKMYFVSPQVRAFLDMDTRECMKIPALGVKVLERQSQKLATGGQRSCSYRLSQEGLPVLLPYLTRQLIRPTVREFRAMLQGRGLRIGKIPDGKIALTDPTTLAEVAAASPGCVVMQLREDDARRLRLPTRMEDAHGDVNHAPLAIACWKGAVTVNALIGGNEGQAMLLRIMQHIHAHGNTEDQAPIDVVAAGKTEHGDDAAEGKKETEDDGGDGVQETDAAG